MEQSSAGRRERRRSPGEGSVYKVEGGRRWRGAVRWTEADGTQRRRVVSGRTQAEARAAVDALRRELHLGTPVPKGRAPTVAEYLAEWIERNRARVRPSTWLVREQHVRLWLVPALGRIALVRLTSTDVERALAAFLKSGRPVTAAEAAKSARPPRRAVSPRTVFHIRTTLRIALNDARREGLVARNAAGDARPPRVPYTPIAYLSAEQAARLVESTRDHEYGPIYALAVSTGLRQGELLALSWPDVDFNAGTLTVRRSLARTAEGSYALGETKTPQSRRTIPLGATARVALRRQQARQATLRLAAGPTWQDPAEKDGLVFADAVGRPLNPPHVTYALKKTLAAAGLPAVRFHDLRHSAATLLLAEGVPLAVISAVLGHTSISVTSTFYAAVLPKAEREAMAALDHALSGPA